MGERFNPDRDVRLSLDEVMELLDAAKRRKRELVKRNERMDGSKPGMIRSNDRSIAELASAIERLDVARDQLQRKMENAVRDALGMEARGV